MCMAIYVTILGIDSSTAVLESIPRFLHKSPSACQILKNDLIL